MNITVFTTTHSGITAASCLAEVGYKVVLVCLDKKLLSQLKVHNFDIIEANLVELFYKQKEQGNLQLTDDIDFGVKYSDWLFYYFKSNEFLQVEKLLTDINQDNKNIVNASTFNLGSAKKLQKLQNSLIVYPNFMIDGQLVKSFRKPDRIIIGGEENITKELSKILTPFNNNDSVLLYMSLASAELTKLATNAMLATRVSFINEIAQIATQTNANIREVSQGIGSDRRIGYDYLSAGTGFGGYSLDYDVQGLVISSEYFDCETPLLNSILSSNNNQKEILFRKIWRYFSMNLKDKKISIWGGSYKPNTAEVINSPSLEVIKALLSQDAQVVIYDKLAAEKIKEKYPQVIIADNELDALNNADALLILTEHKEFIYPDFVKMKDKMKQAVIFDGRNLYSRKKMEKEGFYYYSIGSCDEH